MRRKDREVKNTDWIWNVIEEGRLLHLALIDSEGHPYAVPVNYGYDRDRDCLYFHGSFAGRKAEAMRAHPETAFSIIAGDDIVPHPSKPGRIWQIYRSVMGTGRVREEKDPAEKRRIIGRLKEHYNDPVRGCSVSDAVLEKALNVLVLEIGELTGKTKGYPNPDNPAAVAVREC